MVVEKLIELACVQQHRGREAVCRTIFDPLMELLWTASAAVISEYPHHCLVLCVSVTELVNCYLLLRAAQNLSLCLLSCGSVATLMLM